MTTESQLKFRLADMQIGEDVGLTAGEFAGCATAMAAVQFLTCRAWLSCCSRCLSSALVAAWDSMRASALSASSPAPAIQVNHPCEI